MQDFKKIDAWKAAHELVIEVYKATKSFPQEERFGVTSQVRRAIVSVPTNIAEGSRRRSRLDYAHFLNIAESSLAESRYLLLLSESLGYLSKQETSSLEERATKVSKMIFGLRRKVEEMEANES